MNLIPFFCALGLISVVGIALLLWIVQAAIDAEFNSEPTDEKFLWK